MRRYTISVDGRTICYRRAGNGPVVILLHEMPRSSLAVVPLLLSLAARFTVLAFDMPGHGCSDPLPLDRPEIEDYSDALAAALAALGLARVPVYGTHTGAALALDLGNRHPERVSAVLLDGLALFTDLERDSFLRHYLEPFMPRWDGSHMAGLWSRVRDQYSFFPWHLPGRGARLTFAPPSLDQHQNVVLDLLKAGDRYRLAYAAAARYPALERIGSCLVPVTVMAREDDLLHSHLERLPDDFPRHAIQKLGSDRSLSAEAVSSWFAQYATAGAPEPVRQDGALRFVHDAHGELLLHTQGSDGERPLIFLHNQPGSSRTARPLTRLVARRRQVLTFDLPGSGESSAGGDLPRRLLDAIDSLAIETFDLAGEFIGAVAAIQAAAFAGARCRGLTLIDPPPDGEELSALRKSYPLDLLPLQWDGRHMMMAWHRQRDGLLYNPWYDKSRPAMIEMPRGVDIDLLQEAALATLQGAETEPESSRTLLSTRIGQFLSLRDDPPTVVRRMPLRHIAAALT